MRIQLCILTFVVYSNSCLVLQSPLIDGSPCGYGGHCYNQTCQSGNVGSTISSWIDQNLQIAIPVIIIGSLLVSGWTLSEIIPVVSLTIMLIRCWVYSSGLESASSVPASLADRARRLPYNKCHIGIAVAAIPKANLWHLRRRFMHLTLRRATIRTNQAVMVMRISSQLLITHTGTIPCSKSATL